MTKLIVNGPPSPDELQRQLSDFVRQHFQNARTPAATQPEDSGGPTATESQAKPDAFDFNYKPRQTGA